MEVSWVCCVLALKWPHTWMCALCGQRYQELSPTTVSSIKKIKKSDCYEEIPSLTQGFQDEDACVLGARGICQHLYDSAPSGRHGTMTYMCRALARILKLPINNGDMDCVIS